MFRKWFRILALTAVMTLICSSALALEIMPRYDYTRSITCGFALEKGIAACSGTVEPDKNEYSTNLTVRLQEYSDGWSTIATWSGSAGAGRIASAGGTKSVKSGVDYRVVVSGTIKDADGNVVERPSKISATKSY